ncbi:MAG: sel1 repeat family protein [Muribaculaceae bacterium]|nr:sel1 repeat family protein [Muribaculaceae bacterium]
MGTLTNRFIETLADRENIPEVADEVAEMVTNAPYSPERTGLMAYMYHEGIGVPVDMDECFRLAEKAAFEGGDGLGYFLLGFMCDNAETPDQAEGGPRQKYDHYDAERFYEKCMEIDSRWRDPAILWLGDYYMDSAQGGDPDIAVDYYSMIAENDSEAAGRLSDYYWNLIMPEYLEDEEWEAGLFKWTQIAARLDPEEYAYRMGWIYADGLGCEKSYEEAQEWFQMAYDHGDWRGARAIATLLEEMMEENDLSDEDKATCLETIKQMNRLADEGHQEEIENDPDPSEEED